MPSCCVKGCFRRTKKGEKLSIFRIPAVIKHQGEQMLELTNRRRRLWIARLNLKGLHERCERAEEFRSCPPSVCQFHFVSGHPANVMDENNIDWAPSVNLDYKRDSSPTPRKRKKKQRKLSNQTNAGEQKVNSSTSNQESALASTESSKSATTQATGSKSSEGISTEATASTSIQDISTTSNHAVESTHETSEPTEAMWSAQSKFMKDDLVSTTESKRCRLCGIYLDTHAVPLFHGEGLNSNLPEKIRGCLQLDVKEDDNLPHDACRYCVTQLELFHKFYEKCKNTYMSLKKHYSFEFVSDISIDGGIHIKQEKFDEEEESSAYDIQGTDGTDEQVLENSLHTEFVFAEPLVSIKEEPSETLELPNPDEMYVPQFERSNLQHMQTHFTPENQNVLQLKNDNYRNRESVSEKSQRMQINNSMAIIFQCAYCNALFDSQDASETHIQMNHKKERDARRKIDNAAIELQTSLPVKQQNSTNKISQNRPPTKTATVFRCTYCHRVFATRKDSVDHILSEHKKEREKRFKLSGKEETNNALETANHEFQCLYCKMIFKTFTDAKKHVKQKHKKKHKCTCCGIKFDTRKMLVLHKETCNKIRDDVTLEDKEHKCNFCGKSLPNKFQAEFHILYWHVCNTCGKTSSRPNDDSMIAHRISCSQLKAASFFK